jgi:hypothetical protein
MAFHVDDSAEFEQWLDGERARLSRDYGEALRALATAAAVEDGCCEVVGPRGRA